MDITGDYLFDAPQELVWEALQDPNVLGSIMPGGKGIEKVAENAYKGMLQIKVGPVQGTFQGDIKLSEINPPQSYRIEVDGKGAPGFVKANGSMSLEGRGSQTFMTYAGTAQVGGRIASVGQRLMDSSARSIIRQSLEALNVYLKVQVAEQAVSTTASSLHPSTPASEHHDAPSHTATHDHANDSAAAHPAPVVTAYKPPSQMQLTFNLVRDVLGDFIPPTYRPVVGGLALALIVLVIWYFSSQ